MIARIFHLIGTATATDWTACLLVAATIVFLIQL